MPAPKLSTYLLPWNDPYLSGERLRSLRIGIIIEVVLALGGVIVIIATGSYLPLVVLLAWEIVRLSIGITRFQLRRKETTLGRAEAKKIIMDALQ